MSGVVQDQDRYMKGKIAPRAFHDGVPLVLKWAMREF